VQSGSLNGNRSLEGVLFIGVETMGHAQ
jgi:hypothetical protein